ncbi:brain-specific angiogenesis inhibitor 1-associated protein 2 isoform X3 [Alligator mississippiensis]|uniref:BAR/IMD domain-containing adapter protein 2 n=2 Tax=Alligator mississippiensis TaxID=8496 RepID=A0A151P5Q5_ALLMI|nr:brain-specific angiogenesis inhibitor 1-associated protein 2 isoform X3 [Alligator mississippiensis]KYO44407.1 brain-specific angiogenesis inhibitor 1-associated protein 2 isoform B [Alligator mississippiensis]
MSRSDEVNRLTESVYRVILDQFNPSLRSFVTMGKSYQKALSGVTVAAKGYFDALVKLGELASDSQGSKELGDTLFQMAEVHRQIQVQLEETLKLFHSELLSQLEHKLELDIKYLTATLKKYQSEHRAKAEAIEKCQAELKKLRKKCQSSKNPQKYGDREVQYVEVMSTKQSELDRFVAEGYKAALTEERRRYSFLVDRQCTISKHFSAYHARVKELLGTKLPAWQQSCTQPTRLPERALALVKQTANSPTAPTISEPLPAAKPLEVPPELAPLLGGGGLALNHSASVQEVAPLPNGDSHRTRGSRDMGHPPPSEPVPTMPGLLSPQPAQPVADQTPLLPKASDSYSCTLPMPRKASTETRLATLAENKTLPRIGPLSVLPAQAERRRVQALFSHSAGENSTLLNFQEGDIIALLVTEARDGWHYGENEATQMKGWFPFSYTRPLALSETPEKPHGSFPLSKLNSSSTGNLDKLGNSAPSPERGRSRDPQAYIPSPRTSTFRQRPYSMMNPDLSQLANEFGSPNSSPSRTNPFAHVKLKHTVTNDRSAPLIQ